jgi:hypothetical protein
MESCRVCQQPAVGGVNVAANMASSVPAVMEPRCSAHMVIRIVSTEELQAEVARLTEQLRIARVALAEVVRRPLSPTIRTIATAALNELHAEE